MHYFEDIIDALGGRKETELSDVKVRLHRGRASALTIEQEDRTIDLSEGPDGEMLDGIETRQRYAPHDDERDIITEMRSFPQNEEDIKFLTDLANTIRQQRQDSDT